LSGALLLIFFAKIAINCPATFVAIKAASVSKARLLQ